MSSPVILLVTGVIAGLLYAGLAGVIRALRWIEAQTPQAEARCACRRWRVGAGQIRVGTVVHSRTLCQPMREVIR